MTTLPKIKKVAIVGGGPAGVATVKYLLAENAFTQIDVFEQRSTAGGVWNYTSENDIDADFQIPMTSPHVGLEQPFWRHSDETNPKASRENGLGTKRATFISPLYERLEANLPKPLMQHGDFPFPDDEQLFATHAGITEYLERYADDVWTWSTYAKVRHLIHFQTQVVEVKPLESPQQGWSVTIRALKTGKQNTETYDAVAVANGHYATPFIPDIPGIKEWNERYPGRIMHSKFYRRPEDFKGKSVITIGSGYSGQDIASQIAPLCTPPLLYSTRNPQAPTTSSDPPPDTRQHVPSIAEFLTESAGVRFTDHTTASNIDSIIFCTGYLYAYPFLQSPLTDVLLSTSGARTHNVYQHIFFTPNPTLAFLALPQKIVPFPVSESQAAVIARAWAGRLELPAREEMDAWEEGVVSEKGEGKRFHYLNTPEDVEYVNLLYEWAVGADRDAGEADGGGKVGKTPPRWGPKELWMRTRIAEMKKAFVALGEERRRVKTLEELGFDYKKWKVENAEEAKDEVEEERRGEEAMEEGLVRKISRENQQGKINDAAGGQAEGDL